MAALLLLDNWLLCWCTIYYDVLATTHRAREAVCRRRRPVRAHYDDVLYQYCVRHTCVHCCALSSFSSSSVTGSMVMIDKRGIKTTNVHIVGHISKGVS